MLRWGHHTLNEVPVSWGLRDTSERDAGLWKRVMTRGMQSGGGLEKGDESRRINE